MRYADLDGTKNDVTEYAITNCFNEQKEIVSIDETDNIKHIHYNKWYIKVNVHLFYSHDVLTMDNGLTTSIVTSEQAAVARERTGMHEIGHILGLDDVDACCSQINYSNENNQSIDHHQELLMGYGEEIIDRATNVTYKDLAGISITRGFHTDDDHIWMLQNHTNGNKDVICALCNGKKTNITLDENGLTYNNKDLNIYKECMHYNSSIAKPNLLLVGTDGEREFYKCLNCRRIETIETKTLYNYGSDINETISIEKNSQEYLKLDVKYKKYYEFTLTNSSLVKVKIYDENFNELELINLNTLEYTYNYFIELDVGKYFIQMTSLSYNAPTDLTIQSRTSQYLDKIETYDLLLNSYNNITDYFYVNKEPGFYKFSVITKSSSNQEINYPEGCIKMLDSDKNEALYKLNYNNFNIRAYNNQNYNSFVIFLSEIKTYNFYLNLDVENLKSLEISIEKIPVQELNLFELPENSNYNVNILNNKTLAGDYIEKLEIKQTGYFTISILQENFSFDSSLFILSKLNYNENNETYDITNNIIFTLDSVTKTYTMKLSAGTYYIGYFNKFDNSSISVNFTRIIEEYDSDILIPDPDVSKICGSQINVVEKYIYDKSYGSTEILVGFTRIIYLDDTTVDLITNQGYNWYSSDESIATVSQYGTVFGKKPGVVKIMAVNSLHPSKTYIKEFTILDDDSSTTKLITIKDIHYLSDGEYTLNLTVQNCPYPMIQYYDWEILFDEDNIYSINVTMSQYGVLTADNIGIIYIIGNYSFNPHYTVCIELTIENTRPNV